MPPEEIVTELPIVSAEAPVEPVEVVLTAEEAAAAGAPAVEAVEEKPTAAEPKETPKEPKRGTRADNRVAVATAAATEARRESETLKEENARLKRERDEARSGRQVADVAALDHYEAATKSQIEAAERELADAQKEQDAVKIAAATVKVSKAAANMAQIESFRAANPKPDPKAAKPAAAEPERRQPEVRAGADQLDEHTAKWVKDNSDWFTTNEEMHVEAVLQGKKLERQLRREGKADEIGGADYFKAIDDHMRGEFPDFFGDAPTPAAAKPAVRTTPAMSPGKTVVAPVRQAAQAATPAGGMKVSLSAEERKLAHNMADNGAFMNPQTGARLTHAEAEKRFALTKLQQKAS